jgi:hypothetical protein
VRLPPVDDDSRRPSSAPSLSLAVALPSATTATTTSTAAAPSSSLVYLRLDSFGPRAADEILTALMAAAASSEKEPAAAGATTTTTTTTTTTEAQPPLLSGIGGIVLDLRGNPGGLLDAAVDVASLFLPENVAVASVVPSNSDRGAPQTVKTAGGAVLAPEVPLIVLLNTDSRSAAEVVAAALQEHDRGIVAASGQSFGKASVQQIFQVNTGPKDGTKRKGAGKGKEWGGGSQEMVRDVKITTARYVTASGRALDGATGDADVYRSDSGRVVASRGTVGVVPDLKPPAAGGGKQPRGEVDTAQTPEALLVKSGAFFDFASEFCRRHPALVAQASSSSSSSSSQDISTAVREALSDEARLARDLREFITSDKDDVFRRASALESLDRAEASLPLSSSLSSLIQKARLEVKRDLLRRMTDDPLERDACLARAKDSIRSRLLSEDQRRRASFEDELRRKDSSLSFAFQLLEKKTVYTSALSTSPLKIDDGENNKLQLSPRAVKTIAGYESEGQCLPLQLCNSEEYVYIDSF